MNKLLRSIKFIPLYGIYSIVFFFAAFGKFSSGKVPEWFLKQFSGTILDLFPGALALQFYSIAVCEAIAFLIFVTGLLRREFLPSRDKVFLRAGLTLACFIFAILEIGLQMTRDLNTSAQVFCYFGFSLLIMSQLAEG